MVVSSPCPGMTRRPPGRVRSRCADRLQDLRRRAAPEVRASDRATKKGVAGEEHVAVLAVHPEAEAPRRVPRRVDDLELSLAAGDPVPGRESPVDDAGRVQRQAERLPLRGEILVERPVARVHEDRRARDALDQRRGARVVEVRMRVDEGDRSQAGPGERLEDPVGLVPRVHDDGLAGRRVRHDRAVALERTDREGLDEIEAHVAPIIPLDSPECLCRTSCSRFPAF